MTGQNEAKPGGAPGNVPLGRHSLEARRKGLTRAHGELLGMESKIRIVIADDHLAVRQMLRTTVETQVDMEVVAEAADGREAIELCRRVQPDVLLLDVKMSGGDGISTAQELTRTLPRLKILVLTALEEEEVLLSALRAGSHGYLLKSASIDEILEGIRVVKRDGSVLSPRSAAQLVGQFRDKTIEAEPCSAAEGARLDRLTSREKDVLSLLAVGLNNREIGEQLFISELTAKTHVQNLLRRLGLRDRFQAAALRIRIGFTANISPQAAMESKEKG